MMMTCWKRHHFGRLGLKVLISLVLLLELLIGGTSPTAIAVVQQFEEVPGQMIYQSRQSLRDQDGQTWQVIAFKRGSGDSQAHLLLRLVGFPGTVTLDRSQPLLLKTSLAQVLTAPDASDHLFIDTAPQPYIGQYDLEALLPQLHPEIPLELKLSTLNADVVVLKISPALIQEWQNVVTLATQ